jgi:AcrR family transcriptional regulator
MLLRMTVGTTKAEQSEATRRELVKVARRLFAKRGYAATPIEEIVRSAGVTRGALYHHFEGKQDLFLAVFEEMEGELSQQVADAAAKEPRPELHLEVGCQAMLDACLDPAVQRIALLDAPSVLGWQSWHEIEERHALGLLRMAVEGAMDAGHIERQPAGPLAQVLLGALIEAALAIARAEDVEAARAEIGASLGRLIDGLKPR